MVSADLQKHKSRLTLAIQDVHASSNLDPQVVGAVLRRIREGLAGSVLSISADATIDYEEKGRLLTILAMVTDSIVDAHAMHLHASKGPTLPPLKR